MNKIDSTPTVPFPRFRTILLASIAMAVAWMAWSAWRQEQVRQALFDADASGVERIQAVDKWVELGAPAVAQLAAALSAEDESTRRYAVMALGRLGPVARDAAPTLTALLGHSSDETAMWAMMSLEQIGCDLDQAVPEIIQLLADENPEVVKSAGAALIEGAIGDAFLRAGRDAFDAVAEIANHPDPDSRKHAVLVLSRMGWLQPVALRAVRRATHDPDASIRELAFETLVIWDEMTVSDALIGIQDQDLRIVGLVISKEWCFRDGAETIVPELIELLERSPRPSAAPGYGDPYAGDLSGHVTAALEMFGADAKGALPHYLARLDDESEGIRASAIRTLGKISDGDPFVIARVREQLHSRSRAVCGAAASVLREMSPDDARMAVPDLAQRLSSDDVNERRCAAVALRNLVPDVRDAAVHLTVALNDADESVRAAAVTALAGVPERVEKVLPILIERIRHPVQASRISKSDAIRILSTAGPSAAGAIPVLLEVAEGADEEPYARAEAISALGKIGPDDPRACQLILAATQDPEPQVRSAAARALVDMRCGHEKSVSALLLALMDPQPFVAATAIAGLVRVKADPEIIVPPLIHCLRLPESTVRKCAVIALGELGSKAHAAVPQLLICVDDWKTWEMDQRQVPWRESSLDDPWSCGSWLAPVLARRALRAIEPQALDANTPRSAHNRVP